MATVTALVAVVLVFAPRTAHAVTPHAMYGTGNLCSTCHVPHTATTSDSLMKKTSGPAGQLSVCYTCHDGTGASTDIKSGASNSFALSSGHALEDLIDNPTPDLTNACSGCHSPHKDYATTPNLWKSVVNSTTVGGNDNTWCFACHNDSQSWFVGTYPVLAAPTRDASGFPAKGTYPGRSTYSSTVINAHASIPASMPAAGSAATTSTLATGSCLYCHASHRGPNKYDGLLATFVPETAATVASDRVNGDYAALCFDCHGGDAAWTAKAPGIVNIKQFVTYQGADNTRNSGHRIKTAGGTLPVNAPLPCYDCHNPHGSTRGNKSLLSDAIGRNLDPTTAAGIRQFCFGCHTSSDGKAWDSTSTAYVPAGTQTVEGLRRDGTGGSVLKIAVVTNAHASTDSASCYTCHGSDYATPSSNNVHNPTGGISAGGQDCYGCHSTYQTFMEDSLPNKTGANRATYYHHVLGGPIASFWDGDKAFAAGSYPTSTTDVYCLSCHVDHDKFNASKSGNLRPDIATVNPAGASTDYSTTSNAGVCTSCHATSLTKQVGTDQKSDGSTAAPKVLAGSGANQFGASAHNYYATSTFADATTFNANCSKCHNDPQTKSFQTSANKFSTHYSPTRRILSAFGAGVTDPASEQRCYGCHSGDVAGADAYGAGSMSQAARRIKTEFSLAGSKHPVVASGANSVECENCHNAHVVTKAGNRVTDPANTYNTIGYTTAAEQATFCLKCHSSAAALPAYSVTGATYIPSTVTIAAGDQPSMNKSTNAARSHWVPNGSIAAGSEKSCAVCHESHGSAYSKLLGAYDPVTGTNKINGATITGNDNSVCYACHTAADAAWPAGVRNALGYPTDGTWPGSAVFSAAKHNNATVVYPGAGFTGGLCNNCHDVHGTANTYDELVSTYTSANFKLCFDCHDGSIAATKNIKQFSPTTAGGAAAQTASTRFGHKTLSAGNLAAGSALPCYDCHSPHGNANSAFGLLVVTQTALNTTTTIGDAANEIKMSAIDQATAANVRNFCFSCHTTSDTTAGWNGSAMAVVGAGAKIEGIDRTVYNAAGAHLRLPPVSGHAAGDAQSCYQCHGNDYSSATSNNVHNPTGGISPGGVACYTCHASYQSPMEDSTGSKVGATNTNSYHHVMGSASNEGDTAFGPATYPGPGTSVYCLSCHVDHDKFNANKGANLRTAATAGTAVGSNSDFVSPGGGVCIGCHSVALTKDNTSQRSELASTKTPVIAAADYDLSAHDYTATSSYGASTFLANCAKCHSDAATKTYQTSAQTFGIHYSPARRILAALGGAPLTDPPQEEFACFSCHSPNTAGFKVTANRDWFNLVAMSTSSQAIYGLMTSSSNRLYFKAAAEAGVSGNQPVGDKAPDAYAGGAWQVRAMSPPAPTVAYESYDIANSALVSGTQNWRRVRFVSPAVAATVTVPASAWTVYAYDREANVAAKAFLRPFIYVWRADNATKVDLVTAANYATEMGVTAAPGAAQTMTTANGASVQLRPGDTIVVDLAIQSQATAIANYALTYAWGSGAAGYLQAPAAVTFVTPSGTGHKVGDYSGKHVPSMLDESQAYISANKHVECADCHDPHAAAAGTHAAQTNNAPNALKGASGLTWVVGTSMNWNAAGSTLTTVDGVTKEYQICLKCHSRANTSLTAWNAGWTDVALEFSTANESYHPVFGAVRRAVTATYMKAPWNTNLTTLTMYCSDCHMDSAATPAAQGPHGSALPHVLRGSWTGGENLSAPPADFLCSKCHTLTNTNVAHSKGAHQGFPCSYCHIVRPHGGRTPRLIATVNAPAPYGSGPQMKSFNYPVSGTQDCDTVCSNHSKSSLLPYSWP